jgi:hypothetical protein
MAWVSIVISVGVLGFGVYSMVQTIRQRRAERRRHEAARVKVLSKRVCALCMRAKEIVPRRSWCLSGHCGNHCNLSCKEICAHEFLRVVRFDDTDPML